MCAGGGGGVREGGRDCFRHFDFLLYTNRSGFLKLINRSREIKTRAFHYKRALGAVYVYYVLYIPGTGCSYTQMLTSEHAQIGLHI